MKESSDSFGRDIDRQFNLLINRIGLSSTFADMARDHPDEDKRTYFGQIAYTGYQSAVAFERKPLLTPLQHYELDRRVERLRAKLVELGKVARAEETL